MWKGLFMKKKEEVAILTLSTTNMAADMEMWFCRELGKLGIDATEDNARYILSMDDAQDLEEYMMGLLDASDPNVRIFLQELRIRCGHKPDMATQAYLKQSPEENKKKNKKKANSSQSNAGGVLSQQPVQENGRKSSELLDFPATSPSGEIGVGAKKKSKYIPLFSVEGQAKSVIQLPGRHTCECQAAKHKLINNCIRCGRVVCEQEGAGPCVFCGVLVCTPEDQEVLDRGTKKSEKLRNSLMRGAHCSQKSNEEAARQGAERALKHRDKLLEFDKNSVRRTQVIDDECDYYATDGNRWLSQADREKLRQREEELRKARHGSRRDRKITFDFAGRQILDAEDDSAKKMYSQEDAVIQQVHYGKSPHQESSVSLVNPMYNIPPKFVSDNDNMGPNKQSARDSPHSFDLRSSGSSRIQDKELQEMSDEGMCMSMHQPWASLLVHGIKRHEGRTWYSAHRGRLWIAATVKKPTPEEIADLEHMYKAIYNEPDLPFPEDYPTGCLLGCVSVEDCLEQDVYRQKYPEGESASPYVFICSNPQQLLLKFPMKGQHKIYRLESQLHKAAKKGLR